MKNRCKAIDIFGLNLGLNYKGDQTYKTSCGSFVTVVLVIIIAAVFSLNSFKVLVFQNSIIDIKVSPLYYNSNMVA